MLSPGTGKTTVPTSVPPPPARRRQKRTRSLGPWMGHLVCDDYAGYNDLFADGVTEVGCMAHYLERSRDLRSLAGCGVARSFALQ
ncbi:MULTISPECIES: IS66 family transposase [Comamonas]